MSIYPTLTDLCGLSENPRLEGVSLQPLLKDPNAEWEHVAISTLGQNNHAVRDERWRYIRYADGSEELYDHQTDPNEWNNLAAESPTPSHAKVISRLTKHLPKTNAPQRDNEPQKMKYAMNDRLMRMLTVLVMLTANIASAADPKQVKDYDVVVIGGTPAGVAAAIAAARADKTVIIIEQAPVLGGVLSSGVLRLDDKYVESNSGVMEEFRQRVKACHRNEMADDPLVQAHMKQDPRRVWNIAEGRAWEPHTAARIYAEMVAEHKSISTRFNEVAVDVIMKGPRVTGVITRERDNQGRTRRTAYSYTGKVIIDATYEADLAEYADIPYRIGREARSKEEPHAGRIYTNYFRRVKGTLPATILPESTGVADHRSQAFTYRITAKDYGRPDHPYRLKEPPPGYDPGKYNWRRKQQADHTERKI